MMLLPVGWDSYAQPSALPVKNIIFDQLPEKLGLSQSSINCMLQDREGYLWIGTWSGLIRYDGYSTTVFHSNSSRGKIKSNKITALHEDKNGNLWVGTHMGGLFLYDKYADNFTHFAHDPANPESLSNNNVWSIQQDADGKIWIGTEYGLNVFDGTQNVFVKFFNVPGDSTSLRQNFVTDIFLSADHSLWIGTQSGINRLVKSAGRNTFKSYVYSSLHKDNDLHNYIYKIGELLVDGKSTIWLSTKKGLKKWEGGNLTNFLVDGKPSTYSFSRSLLTVNCDNPYILGFGNGASFF